MKSSQWVSFLVVVALFSVPPTTHAGPPRSSVALSFASDQAQYQQGETALLSWATANAKFCQASGDWSGKLGTEGSYRTGALDSSKSYTLKCLPAASGDRPREETIAVVVVPTEPPATLPAPTLSFAAAETNISSGGSTTLSWTATNADSCSASGGWSGTRSTSGSQAVGPISADTTFALSCGGAGGNVGGSVTVSVTAVPPTVSLSAASTTISSGSSTTLSWSAANATSCSASGGWSGGRAATGSEIVAPTSDTSYTLACSGAGGSDSASVTVAVDAPRPTLSFAASDTSVDSGGSTTLSWTTSHADTCTASGGWSGTKSPDGSETVGPLSAATTYSLACSGAGGSTSGSVTVAVAAAPPTVSLTTASTTIRSGASTTLNWSADNAVSCSASGAWSGSRSLTGSETVTPTSDSTYTLSCAGDGGSDSASVSVAVDSPPPSLSFTAADTSVVSGGSTTLRWTASDADTCTASAGWSGTKSTTGSQLIGPLSGGTTYSLSCSGPGGNVVEMLSISVVSSVAIQWAAPTENVDGTALTDLAGFRIYRGSQAGTYTEVVEIADPRATNHTMNLETGDYYVAMTAFDAEGNESSHSNEVLKTAP